MATAPSRAWTFPTSPRSPRKIAGDLELLRQFDGQTWGKENQLKFLSLLSASKNYEGEGSALESAFAARDRLRAPKQLGFVTVVGSNENSVLRFTKAGHSYLLADDISRQLIFERQMLKVQFPSYVHNGKNYSGMNIRPLTFVIDVLLKVQTISKLELALFVITTNLNSEVGKTVSNILDFRSQISSAKNGRSRKIRQNELTDLRLKEIYAQDLASGRTEVREGNSNFLLTKKRTLLDYADSTFRYLRDTGIFSVKNQRSLSISNIRRDDAISYLDSLGSAISTVSIDNQDAFVFEYLGDPNLPVLRSDDKQIQEKDFGVAVELLNKARKIVGKAGLDADLKLPTDSSVNRLLTLEKLRREIAATIQLQEQNEIHLDRKKSSVLVADMYKQISSRDSEMLDKPLLYEWNTWRALHVINDAVEVTANFAIDVDGNPSSTAPGKTPDLIVEYSDFWLVVEVTLQRGLKQYESENEPITRHVGDHLKRIIENGDTRPVFGLFMAEKINENVIAHLHTTAQVNSRVYAGKVQILPIERAKFLTLMDRALSGEWSSSVLLGRFREIFSVEALQVADLDWHQTSLELITSC